MDSSKPTLTQVQIIQSLAEALSWYEKELSWNVAPAEMKHLTGRIGELYAAMITRGQMALETNQRGYDVVSALNERISVKTITSSNTVCFNDATYKFVDRVMILRVNVDDENGISVEELLNETAELAKSRMKLNGTVLTYSIAQGNPREKRPVEQLRITERASDGDLEIVKYESGTIHILRMGEIQSGTVKDRLRLIAGTVGVDILNSNSGIKNTRTLGLDIIRAINARNGGRLPPRAEKATPG